MKAILISIAAIAIVIAMATSQAVQGYTIDANIGYSGPMLAWNTVNMTNIKITPQTSEKPLTNATLIDSFGDLPQLGIQKTFIAFNGHVQYKAAPNDTRFIPASFYPGINRIVINNAIRTADKMAGTATSTYYIKGSEITGIMKATLKLTIENGHQIANFAGTLHLENVGLNPE